MREVAAGMPPEPRTFMRFAGLEHHGPRRLLNVFPDSALEPESIGSWCESDSHSCRFCNEQRRNAAQRDGPRV